MDFGSFSKADSMSSSEVPLDTFLPCANVWSWSAFEGSGQSCFMFWRFCLSTVCGGYLGAMFWRLWAALERCADSAPVRRWTVGMENAVMGVIRLRNDKVFKSIISLDSIKVMDAAPIRNWTMCLFPNNMMFPRPSSLAYSRFNLDIPTTGYALCSYGKRFHDVNIAYFISRVQA